MKARYIALANHKASMDTECWSVVLIDNAVILAEDGCFKVCRGNRPDAVYVAMPVA